MVFYEPPKRKIEHTNHGKANLARLSDEILLNITTNLPNVALTRLRLVSSQLVGACNETLAKRNTTLYIHPKLSSLRSALSICEHPLFSRNVREIVLLGRDIGRSPPAFPPLCFREQAPWPSEPYPRKEFCLKAEFDSAKAVSFEERYAPLLSALANLPSVQKVAFAQGIQVSGWNQIRSELIESHAQACSKPPTTRAQRMRHRDIDVLFHVLAVLGDKVVGMSFGTDLPFMRQAAEDVRCLRPHSICNLTSLNLVMSIGLPSNLHLLELSLIQSAAPTLQHLHITLIPKHARAQAAQLYCDLMLLSVEEVLSCSGNFAARNMDCYFQKLESLTLEYRDPTVPAKCADPRRRIRPSCQLFDLATLLNQVRRTLRRVAIRNIAFLPREQLGVSSLKDTNLKFHEAVVADNGMAFPILEHFEWRINRYNHDQRCRDKYPRDCDKYGCGVYVPTCTLEMYENTASILGADFESTGDGPEFGSWDFGAAIMKARGRAIAESEAAAKPRCEG